MIDLFKTYKDSCRIRINSCKDDHMKQRALESMITELLEQNELLVNSVIELQHQLNKKDSKSAKDGSLSHEDSGQSQDILSHKVNAADIIKEMNQHLAALQVENEYLRDKNDNLEHDLSNLLKILEVERQSNLQANESTDAVGELTNKLLLTFCDSVNPEDVFGPIEPIEPVNKNESAECQETATSHQEQNATLRATETQPINFGAINSTTTTSCRPDTVCSSFSKIVTEPIASSNLQLIIEEKQLLIDDLQQHLETITKRASLADEVIRKIELKLLQKRQECNEWRSKAFEFQRKGNDVVKENMELKQREFILHEQKRCLLTRLDEQSDAYIRCKEELSVMKNKLIELKQQTEYQAATIEHLKESIINKTKALHSISSGNLLTHSDSHNSSFSSRANSNSSTISKTMQI